MRALDAALGTPWAMLPNALEDLLGIAARENDITPEVLEKYRAEAVARAETLERRGNVAVLNAVGPLFRRANLFTSISGATSYDVMRRDLQVALDDREIRSILLNIDSPGGDANGCGELAKAIYEARGVKPIAAYVGGTAASGGYWIASAASEIVVDDGAVLGSIGVVISLKDGKARDAARGVKSYEFVSSQSPAKRADPATESGRGEYQRMADDLADVFIAAVAKHRGVMPEDVVAQFGGGGVLVGARAVAAGMADRIGTFEDTLARLQEGKPIRKSGPRRAAEAGPTAATSAAPTSQQEVSMADQPTADAQTADIEAARKEAATAAVKADRERRTAIMALPEAKGREALADHLYASTDWPVDQVKAALAVAPASTAPEQPVNQPEADAAAYEASRIAGAGLGGQPKTPKATAAANWGGVAATINKRR